MLTKDCMVVRCYIYCLYYIIFIFNTRLWLYVCVCVYVYIHNEKQDIS